MDELRVARLVKEANMVFAQEPGTFRSSPQPDGQYVMQARGWLGDDAPWHRIVVLAYALADEEEAR